MKTGSGIIIGLVLPFLCSSSCTTHQGNSAPGPAPCGAISILDDSLPGTGCWADDDAFRSIATAMPGKGAITADEKRESARKGAVLFAKSIFLRYLGEERYARIRKSFPPDADSINYTDSNPPIMAFKKILAGGTVVEEMHYPDGACRIIYEIRENKLKKVVADYLNSYGAR